MVDPNQQAVASVMMDTTNPLFSQVAIFAKCLEERQSRLEQYQVTDIGKKLIGGIQVDSRGIGATEPVQPPTPEKRTTRRMQRE